MVVFNNVEEMRNYRQENGVNVSELCEELGMPKGLYSTHEVGHRSYVGEKREQFYTNVKEAIDKIKERKEKK